MAVKLFFLTILAYLAYKDLIYKIVPSCIVIPVTILGIFLTRNFFWSAIMFAIGVFITMYNPKTKTFDAIDSIGLKDLEMLPGEHLIYGGDVKLMAMIGAFTGIRCIAITIFTILIIVIYRLMIGKHAKQIALPVTPFAFFVSLIFVFL